MLQTLNKDKKTSRYKTRTASIHAHTWVKNGYREVAAREAAIRLVMTRTDLYHTVYGLCLVSVLWLCQPGVPAHAASPSVEGRYANPSARWAGSYRLDRYGNAVVASLTAERSPVRRFARTKPQALFTVPEGFRPAQAGIWEVTARQVGAQGEIMAGEPRMRFDVRVTPDGAVRYVDNAKVDSAGYVTYTAILTWTSVETIETIAGEYPARTASGRYRLAHRGATVTLMLSSTRAPMRRLARPRPPILFMIPEGFRPAQTETWEVTGRPVDAQGQALFREFPVHFDMRVTPDGAVRHADNAKADNAGYLAYATAVTWRVPADVCRRTAAVRQDLLLALQAAGRPRVSCAAVTWPDLAAIRSLDMEGVTTLEAGALAGLISLQVLDLYNNPLCKLESGALAGLIRLRTLNLGTTRGWRHTGPQTISAVPYGTVLPPQPVPGWDMADMASERARLAGLPMLPQDAFAGLISLQELSLSRNALTALPSEIFADLGNLEELHLGDNALTALPSGIFADLTRLRDLYLAQDNNDLALLPADLFADLDNLQYLRLGSIALTALPSDLFAGLTRLRRLGLNGHNLTTLPADLFADLDNLETLQLYGNELTAWPAGLFANLGHVSWLSLGLNPTAITSLPSGLLAPLTDLLHLDLSNNALPTLPADIFADLDCLGELLLINNALATPLPADIFAGLSNLKVLFLDGNPGSCPYLTGNSDLCVRPQFAAMMPSC